MTSQAEAGAVPRVITVDWLRDRLDWQRDLEWCAEKQIDRFRRTFGESAELTRANLLRAAEVGLTLTWLAREVLQKRARQKFKREMEATRLEIERATEPAWQDYKRATEAARQNFNRATEPAGLEYEWVRAAAGQEFKRAMAAARLNIERVRANVLADLLGLE